MVAEVNVREGVDENIPLEQIMASARIVQPARINNQERPTSLFAADQQFTVCDEPENRLLE